MSVNGRELGAMVTTDGALLRIWADSDDAMLHSTDGCCGCSPRPGDPGPITPNLVCPVCWPDQACKNPTCGTAMQACVNRMSDCCSRCSHRTAALRRRRLAEES